MKRADRLRVVALATLVFLSVLGAWGTRRAVGSNSAKADLILVPFVTNGVRDLVTIDAKLFIYNPGAQHPSLRIRDLRVSSDFGEIWFEQQDHTLSGDPELGEIQHALELLPASLIERSNDRRWFAPQDALELQGAEAVDVWLKSRDRIAMLQERVSDAREHDELLPFVELAFPVHLDQVFDPDDPAGSVRRVSIEVGYEDDQGVVRRASVDEQIRRLPAWPKSTGDGAFLPGYSIHRGDMHVHSCYGEPVIPCSLFSGLCPAESAQVLTGSFSYQQLKTSYVAQGVDWFTATDHSYCVSTAATYASIVADTLAISTPTFVAIPDIELSSLEQGPQVGTDPFGDIACLSLANANHMGAHGITSQKPGGLPAPAIPPGFCIGLQGFLPNIASIRGEGGYPVANHPSSGAEWAWNSLPSTLGIEAWQMHGVEIWGAEPTFANHLLEWLNWLQAGRIVYGYGGSDLHDDVPADWGANHALLPAGVPLSRPALEQAIRQGRVFVSNGPSVAVDVTFQGTTLLMGAVQPLPAGQPAANVDVRAHYDFGVGGSGSVQIYHGTVGGTDGLLSTANVTGSGTVTLTHALPVGTQSWYRAEATTGVSQNAYSNPVFFVPAGPCAPTAFGTGLGGANVGKLGTFSDASLGNFLIVQIDGVSNLPSSTALLGIALSQIPPPGLPLFGGSLLIPILPSTVQVQVPVSYGQGVVAIGPIPINPLLVGLSLYSQAGGVHTGLPQLIALTNGVKITFCP